MGKPLMTLEKKILEVRYPKGGPIACQLSGVDRSAKSIYGIAGRLMLTSRHHAWTMLERYIYGLIYICGGIPALKECGYRGNRQNLRRRARQFGAYRIRRGKKWFPGGWIHG